MIQNFKPYTKATLVEPMKIQIEKKDDNGETIKGQGLRPESATNLPYSDSDRSEHALRFPLRKKQLASEQVRNGESHPISDGRDYSRGRPPAA
jgi:hypothetical protein